ncbi:hypothetical protein GCM10009646_78400 [Streptomyces aureus]
MGCSHTAGCPLFPLLKASLQGWRDYYCDSEDQWLGCARYQMSLTGERVPISLLPNGARARHLEDTAEGADRSSAAGPEQGAQQARPPQPNPWQQENPSRSQPAPAWPAEPSEPVTTASDAAAQFGPASPTISASHYTPSSSAWAPQPADRPSRRAGQSSRSKRGLWARFTEWMGGPA